MNAFISKLKWLLIIPLIFMAVVWVSQNTTRDKLPVLIELPAFDLKTQDGAPFSKQNLLGHVTLINFIFTSCPTVCPLLTQRMKSIVSATDNPQLRFVSISVDPETDSPNVLKKYGDKFGADWTKWTFLTGTLGAISEVVVKGFKIVLIRDKKNTTTSEAKDLFDITHGEHFVLVDKHANIRAYRMIATDTEQTEVLDLLNDLEKED
ncbi:MAG: SCO family protein [Proteobacteria bacterium]|nr:SCO family protein [Pseudomonadota bacterium]NDC23261.1 SCO family protein [Pseudomonadota bacterium]NDD03688.1 SCO family protein [Pseudomonadota bacterium]NDG26151.1 SCO family protein [Pseudomonadota bacterium]